MLGSHLVNVAAVQNACKKVKDDFGNPAVIIFTQTARSNTFSLRGAFVAGRSKKFHSKGREHHLLISNSRDRHTLYMYKFKFQKNRRRSI